MHIYVARLYHYDLRTSGLGNSSYATCEASILLVVSHSLSVLTCLDPCVHRLPVVRSRVTTLRTARPILRHQEYA